MLKYLSNVKNILILREAFTSLLPIVLVINCLVLFSELGHLLDATSNIFRIISINGNQLNDLYFCFIPLFLNLSLSTLLAKENELDQIGAILISMVCFFRVSNFLEVISSTQQVYHVASIPISIFCTWLSVKLLYHFSQIPSLRIVNHYSLDFSPRLKKSFNLLIPGLLTLFCLEILGYLGDIITQWRFILPFSSINDIQELVLYKTIALFSWFIGIHGEYNADGILRIINNIPNGEIAGIQLKTFHDVFMNIGGSGSTFVLPFIILILRKAKQFKPIAQLSLIFSFINVNEILLFGLPIILNPVFLIPFVSAPFANMIIIMIAVKLNFFSISTEFVHWMLPPLYNAYVATNGSPWAVLIQFLCIVVDAFIYYPFLLIACEQYQAPLHLLNFFGNNAQNFANIFGDDAYKFVSESIDVQEERLFYRQQILRLKQVKSAQRVLKRFRGGQFIPYFQPKVDAQTLELKGLEVLLRFQDKNGTINPPTFLPILYQNGLSKVVDKKVVMMVFEQVMKWRSQDLSIPPISINFDKDFLLDPQSVNYFLNFAGEHNISFCIEITEHTYTVEMDSLSSVIYQLKQAGHFISIDDFGAGYSSLTSLLELNADEIKLDRKLVAFSGEDAVRGNTLLASSIQLCHDLGFSVVAEGVETQEQLNRIQKYGADLAQGYYLGKPMSAKEISKLFDEARL